MGRPLPHSTAESPTDALDGSPSPPAVRYLLDGIEVTQAIQDVNNGVTLVAGKGTVVRVYLSVEANSPILVRGQLRLDRGAMPVIVDSLNATTLDPAQVGNVEQQRLDLDQSLQFSVPATLAETGSLAISVEQITDVATGVSGVPSGAAGVTVNFKPSAILRLRVIGFRWKSAGGVQRKPPQQRDLDLIESWFRRAYPIRNIELIYSESDAPENWQPSDAGSVDTINALVTGIRQDEIDSGRDQRTKYYGLVSDNSVSGGFMRGRATGIPAQPDLSIVASGPTGVGSFDWDVDGSFGDWYCGHELGHTFGRKHPGFCNQPVHDTEYPYPGGVISDGSPVFVGFDIGDPTHGIVSAALPPAIWHDVMTYCDSQWVSRYTYEGLYERLMAEDALGFGDSAAGLGIAGVIAESDMSDVNNVNVIAVIALEDNTGRIVLVNPVRRPMATATTADQTATLKVVSGHGAVLSEHEVPVTESSCADGAPRTGQVNAILPVAADAVAIELWRQDVRLDRFESGPQVNPVRNIRRAALPTERVALTEVAWDSDQAASPQITYKVEVSADSGGSWQTISIGSPTPTAQIRPELFPGLESVQVRITETNGFRVSDQRTEAIPLRE